MESNRKPNEKSGLSMEGRKKNPVWLAGQRFGSALHEFWPAIVVLVALLAMWETLSDQGFLKSFVAPAPSAIFHEIVSNIPTFLLNAGVTLEAVMFGYIFGILVGVPLGIMLAYSRLLDKALYPLVIASQTVPIIALAPILVTLFGFGITPKLIIVALITFFPITVSTVDGMRSVEPELLQFLRSLGATERQIFFKIKVPATLPRLITGTKVSITYAVSAAVIGEWIGAHYGLGALIVRAQNVYYTELMFGAVIVVALLASVVQQAARVIERLAIPWHLEKIKRT